jgi:hypothetical protein
MRIIIGIMSTIVFMVIVSSARLEGQRIRDTPIGHTEWLGKTLKEIQTIKLGMTRRDLVRLFVAEGGLGSSGGSRTYLYRECLYIKVDVEFEPVQRIAGKSKEFPDDKIIKISSPYLGNPTID